jgi:hypothetical protein
VILRLILLLLLVLLLILLHGGTTVAWCGGRSSSVPAGFGSLCVHPVRHLLVRLLMLLQLHCVHC